MRQRRVITFLALAAMLSLVVSCAQSADAAITAKIKTKLAADEQVRASEINVDTADGVVTLTGNVDSEEARNRALELAKETDGVREVNNMISARVGSATGDAPNPDLTLGERIDDAGITMRVKARFMEDPVVKAHRIDVDTKDGVVFLTGSVPGDAERNQAIELARTTKGVKDVQANWN
jgi:hyperosmotically inducible periplasmic protein